jgi:3-deoxy-D-manno-octulosonic-acid transferase
VRTFYIWLLRVLLPLIPLRLFWRGFRNRAYWHRIPERFGFIDRLPDARVIWVHAVSVGETRAAGPLVRALFDRYPEHRVLITTMTPTGSATVKALFGDGAEPRAAGHGRPGGGFGERVAHCYVPYDYPSAVRRFLERTHPAIAIIMETELWPNLFHACHARGVPILVANVRMSERSMRGYQRVARLTRATLRTVRAFGVQTRAEAQRMLALGASPDTVHVTGSMKFEMRLPASLQEQAEVLRRDWGASRPVWIAASTHEGEDEPVLVAHAELKKHFADALLVLVPRHPERFAAVARLCQKAGFKIAQRSQYRGPIDASVDVVLGDTMGELQLFFAASDCAFVGGSLVATGGHNVLEASAVGKPVVFGPHMFNFTEIAALTLERGAGTQIERPEQLAAAVAEYLSNPVRHAEAGEAGRKLVEENRGALEHTLELIEQLLPSA